MHVKWTDELIISQTHLDAGKNERREIKKNK